MRLGSQQLLSGLCFVLGGSGGCSPRGPGGVGLLLQGLFSPLSKEFYRVCQAHECEFGSLGLGLVAGRTPEPPHGARGRSVVSLSFLTALTHPFSLERRGLFVEPPRV